MGPNDDSLRIYRNRVGSHCYADLLLGLVLIYSGEPKRAAQMCLRTVYVNCYI